MIRDGMLGRPGVVAIMTTILTTWVFLPLISVLARSAKSAAWIAVPLGAATAAVGYSLVMTLLKRFPGRGLLEVTLEVGGPVFGRLLVLTYGFFFLAVAAGTARVFGDGVVTAIMPRTPLSIHLGTLAVVMLYSNFGGLEAMARVNWLLLPLFILSLIVLVGFNVNHFIPNGILPILGNGPIGIVRAGLTATGVFGEILALPILFPMVRRQATAARDGLTALVLSVAVGTSVVLASLLCFPDGELERRILPLFELGLLLHVGTFFSRVEVIFIFMWFFAAASKLAIALYLTNLSFCTAFKLPGYRPVIPIMLVLFYAAAFMPRNITEAVIVNTVFVRPLGAALVLGAPVVLLLAARVRGLGGKTP
jgi:spore germination protein KB